MIKFNLHKTFSSSNNEVKIKVNAELEQGKIIALYGKSGVGKTSLLRMLAGLMNPDGGSISIGDQTWFDRKNNIDVKANKRNVGMVFQEYSLFPNMNILKNIRYGLDPHSDEELVKRIIEIADLGDLLDRMPSSLSGGQQQRVALARAIVRKPKLLLLDEPLSALDTDMRAKLQEELLEMQKVINTSIILVSHHLPEVFKLADEVIVMEDGLLTQRGTPSQVFMDNNDGTHIGEFLLTKKIEGRDIVTLSVDGKIISVQIPND